MKPDYYKCWYLATYHNIFALFWVQTQIELEVNLNWGHAEYRTYLHVMSLLTYLSFPLWIPLWSFAVPYREEIRFDCFLVAIIFPRSTVRTAGLLAPPIPSRPLLAWVGFAVEKVRYWVRDQGARRFTLHSISPGYIATEHVNLAFTNHTRH